MITSSPHQSAPSHGPVSRLCPTSETSILATDQAFLSSIPHLLSPVPPRSRSRSTQTQKRPVHTPIPPSVSSIQPIIGEITPPPTMPPWVCTGPEWSDFTRIVTVVVGWVRFVPSFLFLFSFWLERYDTVKHEERMICGGFVSWSVSCWTFLHFHYAC